nr:hypothetical protein [Tanacetum cinerariifolium]
MKKYDYGHLEEIEVHRDDHQLYKFKEDDSKRLRLQDIEDMLLFLVQQKLTNLTIDERYDLNVVLYPHGVIYMDRNKRKRLMRTDELYKFSDETLNDVQTALHDNDARIKMDSMLNHDSSIISSSSKIDSLPDVFAGELTLLKSILLGVDKTDCYPENEIHFSERLLYDNSSPRPPEEFNSENSNAKIESFSQSPIPNEDSDSFMEEIDLFLTPDDPMLPRIEDDEDSEGDILFLERLLVKVKIAQREEIKDLSEKRSRLIGE